MSLGKISVIIPVYNVEKYLSECLDSVLAQTYDDLEIILIDDGATDNSGKICDSYAMKDRRVNVIHQSNAGAGAAKNAGLDIATGDYIAFADSDDILCHNMYDRLLKEMTDSVDLVQCCFSKIYKNGSVDTKTICGKFTADEFLCNLLLDWKNNVFCNKLFKADLVNGVRFPVGRTIDDEFFTYKAIGNSSRIVVIEDCLYKYRIRQSSVMNDGKKNRLVIDRLDYLGERYDYICANYPKIKGRFKEHMTTYLAILGKENKDAAVQGQIDSYVKEYRLKLYENSFDKLICKVKGLFATQQPNYNIDMADDNLQSFE